MTTSTVPQPSSRTWLWFLLLGCLLAFLYQTVPDKVTRDLGFIALGLLGSLAILAGVHLNRPALAWPWYVMGAGNLIWVAGDATYTWYEDVLHAAPFPSPADALYLVAYPVLAVGLHLLAAGRRPERDLPSLIDGAMLVVALGLISWVVLAAPAWEQSKDSWVAATVASAYPMADILLVAMIIRLLAAGGTCWSLRLLLVAVSLLVVADTLYLALGLFGVGESLPIDFLWLTAYIVWGSASLHPSMAQLSQRAPATEFRFRLSRQAAMTTALLVSPLTIVGHALLGRSLDLWPVTLAGVALAVLVMLRMRLAIGQMVAAKVELERLHEVVAFQAAHDGLTELPNRTQVLHRLASALGRAQRRGDLVGVLFIDLDGFKAVNDGHGHPAGDQVLRQVAARLVEELRVGDVAGRLGGDEFVVVLDPLAGEADAVRVADRLVERITEPIRLSSGIEVRVGASVGVALNLDSDTDPETLLQEADFAVYLAKANGRGRVEVFSSQLADELRAAAELEEEISQAIDQDELVVHYQPIRSIRSGRIEGYEALVRWPRSDGRILHPAEFIPVAERSDLICQLDSWVLDNVLAQLEEWNRDRSDRDLFVSVNISGRHVNKQSLFVDVAALLGGYDVDANQLVLELTETVAVNADHALDCLLELRRMGVGLSIDDFGTGYSSIAQLSRLPVGQLKIARSYLADVTAPGAIELLRVFVHTAHSFRMTVVGEGVERADQLEALADVGADYAQGFLLGEPADLAGAQGFGGGAEFA